MVRNTTRRLFALFTVLVLGLGGARAAVAAQGQLPQAPEAPESMTDAQKLARQRATAFRIKHATIWEGARVHFREAHERAELVRRARRGDRAAIRGLRARRAGNDEGPLPSDVTVRAGSPASPLAVFGTQAIPTNVRCNNPAGDGASAGQSEESVAAIGNNIVVAWNDGQGFNTGLDVQGYGWSSDGGATFTDGGSPLHSPLYPSFRWTSDPVMTVNEKTGDFWYCGLANTDATNNAIAVARGRFTAGVFGFDSVFIVRRVPNASMFLDKQWVACDSATGNVYVTNTTFGAVYDTIDFYRSVDGGRTWSTPVTISSSADAGNVQGSRVTVAPNGNVLVTWYAAQASDDDAIRFRYSNNQGASFFSEVTPSTFYQQFGTGAPGFNRPRGVSFPAIAVDHSSGPHRGRTYIAWQEAWHFLSVALPPVGASTVNEVEINNTAGTATPFTAGQTLSGQLATVSSTRDFDYWAVALAAGQNIVLYTQPTPTNRGWTMRLYAPDGTQQLCFAGNSDTTATYTTNAYYSFTAPVSGTYYLRMAASSSWQTTTYSVYTALGAHGAERGRDQRDGFVTWSDNGVTWSTPTRINDDAIGYDLFLPEVAVGNDGAAYTTWFDHRDDTYGSRANVYMTRSNDGGATWAANAILTSAQTNFTTVPTNIAPNMGDYLHLASSGTGIVPVWADGRSGTSVDVWSTTVPVTSSIAACAGDTTMNAPGTATRGWLLANNNPVFAGSYGVALTNQRAWPMPAPANVTIPAAGTALYGGDVAVPDTAASGTNRVCLTLTTPAGVVVGQCCYTVTVIGQPLGVPGGPAGGLALARSRPNPAFGSTAIAFTLPRAGRARLAIYDLTGARVRTLVDGPRPAGSATVTWDGRDERGASVRAGAYFYRLEFGGQTLTERLVLMR